MNTYLLLVSLLLGPASSQEPVTPTQFEIAEIDECHREVTNIDSIVLDNVTLINGLLGYKVQFWGKPFGTPILWGETGVLLGTTLGYNPFLNTVTFNAGQLVFLFDDCSE